MPKNLVRDVYQYSLTRKWLEFLSIEVKSWPCKCVARCLDVDNQSIYGPTSIVKEQIRELDQTLTLASQSSRLSYDLYIQPTAINIWP